MTVVRIAYMRSTVAAHGRRENSTSLMYLQFL